MTIIVFTKPNSQSVGFVITGSDVEDWQYVPKDATKARVVTEADLPLDRDFRDAWCDVLEGTQIDICLTTAKEIQLARLQRERDIALEKLHKSSIDALLSGSDDVMKLQDLREKRNKLLSATAPLSALKVEGLYNDADLLREIRKLGTLSLLEE